MISAQNKLEIMNCTLYYSTEFIAHKENLQNIIKTEST